MNSHKLTNASVEGPLGFPMTDRQAIALDAIIKSLPKSDEFRYRKAQVAKGASEVLPGERCDVSWISTETPDRVKDVVSSRGMNDSQFKLNPIVTMGHNYEMPPVGKSIWRKAVRDGEVAGIKAKTQYPVRPEAWPADQPWPADVALSLVQADLLRGKSIGILPTKVHIPTSAELENPGWNGKAELVIDEWLLLEYACTFLPVQQQAVVDAVSKGEITLPVDMVRAMGLDPEFFRLPDRSGQASIPVLSSFTPLEEIEKHFTNKINSINVMEIAAKAAQEALDRHRGRV
jgi:hypothetical protein